MKTVDPRIGDWPCAYRDGHWWVRLPKEAQPNAAMLLGSLYATWATTTKEPATKKRRK